MDLNEVKKMAATMIAEQMGSAVRDSYSKQYMNDLPETYQSLLPQTADRQQLRSAEAAIRAQYRADLAKEVPKWVGRGLFLGKAPGPEAMEFHQRLTEANQAIERGDLEAAQTALSAARATGGDPNASPAEAPPDFSKMSAIDKIAYGLKLDREGRAGAGVARPQPPANSGAGAVDTTRLTAGQKILLGLQQEGLPWRR